MSTYTSSSRRTASSRRSTTTIPMRTSSSPSNNTERFYSAHSTTSYYDNTPRAFHSSPRSGRGHNFYAVKAGRQTGIFTSWSDAHAQVGSYSNAVFQGFATREEAEKFMASEYEPVPPKKGGGGYGGGGAATYGADDLAESMAGCNLSDDDDDRNSRAGTFVPNRNRRTSVSSSAGMYSTHHHHGQSRTRPQEDTAGPAYTMRSSSSRAHTASSPYAGTGTASYHGTQASLDELSEFYLKSHYYPHNQVTRIRRVLLRRWEEGFDESEVQEDLVIQGMEADRALFLVRLFYRNGQ